MTMLVTWLNIVTIGHPGMMSQMLSYFILSFFLDTIFVVDGFHFKGHTNCSHGYNSSLLKAMQGVSSVLHEQKNAQLSKLKIPTVFMRYDCFVLLLQTLTTLMNVKELK